MNQLSRNPYAPPKAQTSPMVASDCRRDGNILVVPHGHDLPHRCVKCNAPAEMDKPRKFAWHHPGWYSLILINVIFYAIIAAFVQKRAKVSIGLCEDHRRRRRNFTIAAWIVFLIGLAGLFLAIGQGGDPEGYGGAFALAGGLSLLGGAVVGIIGSRTLSPERISAEEARLKGCCDAFLDNLHTR